MGRVVLVRIDDGVRLEIPEHFRERVLDAFTHKNPSRSFKQRLKIPGWWSEPEYIRTWKAEPGGGVRLTRGSIGRLRELLTEDVGVTLDEEDARHPGTGPALRTTYNRPLWDFQAKAQAVMEEREQGILRAPTGSGKTSVLLSLAAKLGRPTLVVLPNRPLLDQWADRARAELDGLGEIGIIGDGKFDLQPLTLGIARSVGNRLNDPKTAGRLARFFGTVIGDECHLCAAPTFLSCFDPMPARYRFGASADERRKDGKDFLIRDVFGHVVADIPRKQLEKEGRVIDVDVRLLPTDFEADWYGMPDDEKSESPEEALDKQQKQIDFVRLCQEMSMDAGRQRAALELIAEEARAGERVIVWAHEREHCQRMVVALGRLGIRVGLMIGGDEDREEFERTHRGLVDGSISVGVGTYKSIGTGFDLPELTVGVAVTPIAGNRQLLGQVRGRVCRSSAGKKYARLWLLWDRNVFPTHAANAKKWYGATIAD